MKVLRLDMGQGKYHNCIENQIKIKRIRSFVNWGSELIAIVYIRGITLTFVDAAYSIRK